MGDTLALSLLLFFVQLGVGGGLYETLVVYPRWKYDATPASLPQKLKDSGQSLANRRFWPFPSMGVTLLSIINIALALHSHSAARSLWLTAATIIFLNRVVTFSYFAPTMVRRFQHSQALDPVSLAAAVKLWTTLSPLRIGIETIAWAFGIAAISTFRSAAG